MKLDFEKMGGLIPAIVQDNNTSKVLMLGFMKNVEDIMFFKYLQNFIERRRQEMPEGSYTTTLFLKGVNRMAQKVGEEAVETVIEATNGTEDGFIYEASDLVYHLIVLLTSKGLRLEDLARELKKRHKG